MYCLFVSWEKDGSYSDLGMLRQCIKKSKRYITPFRVLESLPGLGMIRGELNVKEHVMSIYYMSMCVSSKPVTYLIIFMHCHFLSHMNWSTFHSWKVIQRNRIVSGPCYDTIWHSSVRSGNMQGWNRCLSTRVTKCFVSSFVSSDVLKQNMSRNVLRKNVFVTRLIVTN